MKPLIFLVNAKEDKITLTYAELNKICEKFYEAGVEDGLNMETKAVRIIKEPEECYSTTGGDTDV